MPPAAGGPTSGANPGPELAAVPESRALLLGDIRQQINRKPLLQRRLVRVAATGCLASLGGLLAGYLSLSGLAQGGQFARQVLTVVGLSGAVVNLGFLFLFRRVHFEQESLLDLSGGFCFLLNALLMVTIPTALNGNLGALAPHLAGLIVLARCVFVPSPLLRTLLIGLALWALYPLALPLGKLIPWAIPMDLSLETDWRAFVAGNFAIGTELAMGLVAASVLHGLELRAFRAEQAGNYQLRERLGRGGMGDVYRAEHAMLRRPTAVKMLRPEMTRSAPALRRFEREVRAVSELRHPNTISIYDFGRTVTGRFYYAMEYLEGTDLQVLIEQHGAIGGDRTVFLIDQLLASLEEAHLRGILHRDIKPSNVYVTVAGMHFDFVKVLDFGLVKQIGADADPAITLDGLITGTPLYMAPERFYGEEQVDHRSDLYAVGAVAYFLLAGRPVFEARNAIQALAKHIRLEPVPLAVRGAEVSEPLEQVIFQLLRKEPQARFEDATAVRRELRLVPEWDRWTQERGEEWWQKHKPEVCSRAHRRIFSR